MPNQGLLFQLLLIALCMFTALVLLTSSRISTWMRQSLAYVWTASGAALATSVAHATTQYDTMVAAVTFTDVITALLAVGAVILGVVITTKGIHWIIGMIRARS